MIKFKRFSALVLAGVMAFSMAGCVDQHQDKGKTADPSNSRIVATSNATLQICDRLGLDLVGICQTSGDIPEKYKDLPTVGTAMAPDAEQISLLEPTDIIGPDTLRESIEPTYEAASLPYTFINLQSVEGMYESIAMLGKKYGVTDASDALQAEYEKTLSDFEASIKGKKHPRVLVLMGLPGSYIACTPNSYVGSLVELAGAENVVQVDDNMNFVSWNTEELLDLDPDMILLTAHGLPDLAMDMFAKEFSTNDIWKHFRAVQDNHVYQLDFHKFGMSCTFDWPESLNILKEILYDGTAESYDAEAAYAASSAESTDSSAASDAETNSAGAAALAGITGAQ